MKKILTLFLIVSITGLFLVGCGQGPSPDNKIIIGVSPEPHAGLVKHIVEDLGQEGIEVELKEFTDYVMPNNAVNDEEIDANFFQHEPYLIEFNEANGMDLVSIGGVHIEPMALYSMDYTSIDDFPKGARIAIPNDTSNGGRALLLLEAQGIIKLADGVGLTVTENDIVENPKELVFTALEAAALPRILGDVDGAVINGNYALEADLNPVEDGLIIEGEDSPYANIVAVKKGQENEDKFIKLMEALQSDSVKDYIKENYEGALVPAF